MKDAGYTLIELVLVVVIIGILASIAVQSLKKSDENQRFEQTAREMDMLARAIVGDERLVSGGIRTDFGYVGDIGALPPNLDALVSNPGGYSTWNGPYIRSDFVENSGDYRRDAWDNPYSYSGGITISSTGGGSSITKQFANSASSLTSNTIYGIVRDRSGCPPSDSASNVIITVYYPDGGGSTTGSSTTPARSGEFSYENSIPMGLHLIRAVVASVNDTTAKYVAVNPGSKVYAELRFPSILWGEAGSGGGCSGPGTMILRPNGAGTYTGLASDGCSSNWQCVDETTTDEDATRVKRPSNSYDGDRYALEDPADTSCTISGVTVYVRARKHQAQGQVEPILRTSGTVYIGTEQSLSQSYEDYGHQWTTNPNTGSAWTWQEIIGLEAGVRLRGQNSNFPAYCTQVWVVVAYSD